MRKLTVDIVEEFIQGIELTAVITVVQYLNASDTTLIKVNSELFHLRNGMSIEVVGVGTFKVANVDRELFAFTVSGNQLSSINTMMTITIPNPYYFHGTPRATSNTLSHVEDADQVPMIYLREVLREVTPGEDSAFARIADLRLFFIDNANLQDWLTDDHYSKRLAGLNDLVDKFIKELREEGVLFSAYDVEFERYNRPNWGEYADLKGYEATIFSGHYTSVEVNCSLPIFKQDDCNY